MVVLIFSDKGVFVVFVVVQGGEVVVQVGFLFMFGQDVVFWCGVVLFGEVEGLYYFKIGLRELVIMKQCYGFEGSVLGQGEVGKNFQVVF